MREKNGNHPQTIIRPAESDPADTDRVTKTQESLSKNTAFNGRLIERVLPNYENYSRGKKIAIKIGSGFLTLGIASGIGFGAVKSMPNQAPPETAPSSEPFEMVPSEGPEAPINLENNTYTISPESLEGLTSEEMTERFTIPVVSESGDITTPEDFAQHYVENMEGLYNAGSGASDLEANQDLSLTEHMDATGAKYDNPIISGIFAEGVNSDLPREIHTGHAQNALISSLFGDTDVPYRVDFELESSITTQSPAIPGDGFTVEIVYVAKNNLIESGVFDFFKGTGKDQIPLDERIVSTVTVIPQNGALKVKDSESSRF